MAGGYYQLPSQSFAAGGNVNVLLKDLPKTLRGRIPHVRRIIFDVDMAPTFTTAPTTVGVNNIVARMDVWDGTMMRFTGGFNALRARERLYSGGVRIPDADTDPASTNHRFFRRVWHCGPPCSAGGLADFQIPTGCLVNGWVAFQWGALTDISADTTALTATVRITVELELCDELRIPPAIQWVQYNAAAADLPMAGRALYLSIVMAKTNAFSAWSNGDIGKIKLDFGAGDIITSTPAQLLTAAYLDDFAPGEIGPFIGEPGGANDDNNKTVNHASPTAIAAGAADLQVAMWLRDRQKLTKSEVAETSARLQWDGSNTTAYVMAERILPMSQTVLGAYTQQALTAINKSGKTAKIKTLSKKPYPKEGPLKEFLPYAIGV